MNLTIAEINLSNLIHNLNQVRANIPSGCKILAVVKANAYGHGSIEVSRELVNAGVDMLGVATLNEGVRLREAGIDKDILVLGVINEDCVPDIIRMRLTPVVFTLQLTELLSDAAVRAGVTLPVHVKIDTGMKRIGVDSDDALDFVSAISNLKGIRIEGVMTHFAEADLDDKNFVIEQFGRFMSSCRGMEQAGIRIPLKHVANSAAIIDMKETHLDMVRPGLMLYGYSPSPRLEKKVELRQVMAVKSRIIYLKRVPAKTGISYGRTFTTSRDTVVATLPVGYADGYSRSLSNTGEVIVRGVRAPVIGRVCMDMTMVDVTDIPGVSAGDEVSVIGGRDGKGTTISANEIAGWTNTISYEVLCRIGERVERVYVR
ncbi:MAG: alanine racemase [Nitrospirae bacterium]|nr:alanine racemase [Nitrospirota bacterium]